MCRFSGSIGADNISRMRLEFILELKFKFKSIEQKLQAGHH